MKILKFFLLAFVALILNLNCTNNIFAWNDTTTHPDITTYVLDHDQTKYKIVDYLNNNLGFKKLVKEEFKIGKKTYTFGSLLSDGAKSEDLADRGFNHFYDPVAGDLIGGGLLHDYANSFEFKGNQSNVVWAIGKGFCERPVDDDPDENSNDCNDFSWIKARDALRMALTSNNNEERDKMFIRSFRSLGQVVHLMQDMAVPAHTRNDFKGHVFA